MRAFTRYAGRVAPLMRANIDTDQIIPKQFLTVISRTGLGNYLFDAWRFDDPGELGKKPEDRPKKADFVLNQPQYANAGILLAGNNFGCGSSREHAVWSLYDYGIRVVIAPGFADIFYSNAITNGLLPAQVSPADAQHLATRISTDPQQQCSIDLPQQTIVCGDLHIPFVISQSNKTKLLQGLDPIAATLEQADAIRRFEQQHLARYPWLDTHIQS